MDYFVFPEWHEIRALTPECIPVPKPFELEFLRAKGVKFHDPEIEKLSSAKYRLFNCQKMTNVSLPPGWRMYKKYGFETPYEPKAAYICDEMGHVVVEILWDWKFSSENMTQVMALRYCTEPPYFAPKTTERFIGKIVDGWIIRG